MGLNNIIQMQPNVLERKQVPIKQKLCNHFAIGVGWFLCHGSRSSKPRFKNGLNFLLLIWFTV